MGDRTTVTLRVLASQREATERLIPPGAEPEEDYEATSDDGVALTAFTFHEVNYGSLNFLDDLRDAGIAYDSHWEDGGDYTAGTNYCRFDEAGQCIEHDVYDSDTNPNLSALMACIDQPEALRELILEHHEKVCALPWATQEHNSKLFLAHSLLGTQIVLGK